jgi:protein-disulfide isomerase
MSARWVGLFFNNFSMFRSFLQTLGLLAIIGLVTSCGLNNSITTNTGTSTTKWTGSYPNSIYVATENKLMNPMVVGSPNAKVDLKFFTDYQCPACGEFHRNSEDIIWEKFIDTGLARVTFYNFPLTFDGPTGGPLHPNAEGDALASMCSQSTGKFRDYRNALYALESSLSKSTQKGVTITDNNRVELAKKAGIVDIAEFESCLKGAWHQKSLEAQIAEGDRLRVSGTPTVFIGEAAVRYTTNEQLISIIEAAVQARK